MNLEVVKDYYGKVLKSSEDLQDLGLLRRRRCAPASRSAARQRP